MPRQSSMAQKIQGWLKTLRAELRTKGSRRTKELSIWTRWFAVSCSEGVRKVHLEEDSGRRYQKSGTIRKGGAPFGEEAIAPRC